MLFCFRIGKSAATLGAVAWIAIGCSGSSGEGEAEGARAPDAALLGGDSQASPKPTRDAGDAASDVPDVDLGPLGDTCANPTVVVLSGRSITLENETTTGLSNSYSGQNTCMLGNGRDHVYAVTIPAHHQLTALALSGAGFNQLVEIVAGDKSKCESISSSLTMPGSVCAVGDDDGNSGEADMVAYYNAADRPTNAFVIVDAQEDNGPESQYSLTLTVEEPPPGDACETAVHIAPGLLENQSTVGYANNYGNDTSSQTAPLGCARAPGPERVYSIDVPPSTKLLVESIPVGDYDTAIGIVVGDASRCNIAPRVCDSANDDGWSAETDTAAYINGGNVTVTAYIMIDSYQHLAGTFSLRTTLTPVTLDHPGGDTCESPEVLSPPDENLLTVRGTTVGYQNYYSGSSTCMTGPGRDHVYAVTVPPNKQLYATLISDQGFDHLINLVPGNASACGSGTSPRAPRCAVGADGASQAGTDTGSYFNATGAPQNVFIMADAFRSDTGGMYSLALRVATPPPGEVCEQADAVVPGTIASTLDGYGNNYGNASNWTTLAAGCSASAGADHVFRIDVDPGKTLTASVLPSSELDTSVNLVVGTPADCSSVPRVCTTSDNSGGAGEIDSVDYKNTSSVIQTVFIIVDTFEAVATGSFSLTTSVR